MTSGDGCIWTLSDEEASACKEQLQEAVIEGPSHDESHQQGRTDEQGVDFEDEKQQLTVSQVLSPRDLISVSDANRPSIDKVLPTRYS